MNVWNSLRPWALLSLLCVAPLVACDEDERSEPYQVTELRVLAIRGEPAEAIDATPVLFDALVVSGTGELTYEWRLCPFAGPAQLGFPCLADEIPEEELSQIPDEIKPCIVGETAETPSFTVTPCSFESYQFILEAAAQAQGFPLELDPETGLEMSVRLQVSDETGRLVEAIKSFSVTGSKSPNSNPALTGLVVQEEPELEPNQGVPWTEDETLVVGLEEAPILQVLYDEAIAELEAKLDSIQAALDAETQEKSRLLEEQESEMRSAHASEVEALEGRAGAEEQAAAERARVLEEQQREMQVAHESEMEAIRARAGAEEHAAAEAVSKAARQMAAVQLQSNNDIMTSAACSRLCGAD